MPTENDIDKIKKDLASLRAASDLAKKSAQTASRQIKEVEGKDFGKLFDKQFKSLTNRAARSFDSALQSLLVEGDSFKTVFKKLGADLLKNVLSSLPHGNIASSILPFARGGVLNSPALFPLKRGIGLAGEAGPEAILPLSRGADGRLGVRTQPQGGQGVQVNVNITTPDAQSFRRSQTQIAGMLRRAVQRGQRNL